MSDEQNSNAAQSTNEAGVRCHCLPSLRSVQDFAWGCAKWALALIVVNWLLNISPLHRDETDPGEWGSRSNMALRTDHGTGCQYLEAGNGGLTPRIGADGQQMGCR